MAMLAWHNQTQIRPQNNPILLQESFKEFKKKSI